MLNRTVTGVLFALALFTTAQAKGPIFTDPEKADADFALQGEYLGKLSGDGDTVVLGLQVIAQGGGKFTSVAYVGGLPGAGWDGDEKFHGSGELKDGVVILQGDEGRGELKDGVVSITTDDGAMTGKLKKTARQSSTLGQAPPKGAVVLFDGSNSDGWTGGKMTEDGLLMQGCTSKQTFGSHQLHLEFRLPFQPEDRGQGRGNSGIYFQGRYEVQMLDSFGLQGEQNECGGIYSVAEPSVNMCLPPLTWQTYDAEFTAAKYDDAGKLVKNPRITVKHNGVVIHDDIELPGDRNTTAAPLKASADPGPVYLQNHGNPVRYRNIWVVPRA
ncbi:MAG: DUF1080 domain-containing protein [Planctomycetes bacterium]|nr:DUF1080 domain-containing protein [Planctomycetota bacterium]